MFFSRGKNTSCYNQVTICVIDGDQNLENMRMNATVTIKEITAGKG